jgi:hypothetical protein
MDRRSTASAVFFGSKLVEGFLLSLGFVSVHSTLRIFLWSRVGLRVVVHHLS